MSKIEIINVSKIYKEKNKVLDKINITVDEGEFICFLGPSGCGKSTLLNMLAGFEKTSEGEILIDGRKVYKPEKSRITIFQDYGLLPWRNVEKNVLLGLENVKLTKKEKEERVKKYVSLVGLDKNIKQYPSELSGGMQQRVSIARALVSEPEIIFMDEPFGALDPITRLKLQKDIKNIWNTDKKTIIFVTHDVEEAIYLGTKIVIMAANPGRVVTVMDNKILLKEKKGREFYFKKEKILDLLKDSSEKSLEYFI